ncbi:hypothetical protein VTN02DRAFT_4484 [Thermoascus thermophilus]
MSFLLRFGFLAAAVSSVTAQTWTACNPLNTTDCPPDLALGDQHTWTFNETSTLNEKVWTITAGDIAYSKDGAEFTIAERLDSPTIQSEFYIFFGIVESHVKAATGGGVVSSVVLQSDDLDEIDWEWIGSDGGRVQSNYYGKGNATYGRAGFHDVEGGATDGFHNYTTHWTKEKLEWWIDGKLVRTVTYEDALGGKNYPQTPCNVRIGIWPGGDPKNPQGTIEWAGGPIDYNAVPYTMTLKQLRVQDFSSGKEYRYGDTSGSWQSIQIVKGNSTVKQELNKPPPKPLSQRWKELPRGAKIAIYCVIAGVCASALGLLTFCCIKQRRLGRKEYSAEATKYDSERTEMLNWQTEWKKKGGYQPVNGS